jgi:hypothetical protein
MRIRRFLSHIPIPAVAGLSLVVAIAVSLIVDTPTAQFGDSSSGSPFTTSRPATGEQPPILPVTRAPELRDQSLKRAPQGRQARVADDFGQLPLSFEPNGGQTDARVKYLARGRGYTLFLTSGEAILALRKHSADSRQLPVAGDHSPRTKDDGPRATDRRSVLRMNLVGANPAAQLAGADELPGKSNYFVGNDPAKWRTNVPHFRRVIQPNVYPGIDVVYYGQQRELEYDFVVAPGADPDAIHFNIQGAQDLRIDLSGDLLISVPGGELRMHKPVVYQQIAQVRQPISGSYVLSGDRLVGFRLSSYDPSRAVVIDPTLSYSTYLGGTDIDVARGIAVGADGTAFVVGETDSVDFPVEHALQPNLGGGFDFPDDIFVSKISRDGGVLIYSTYLGGAAREYAGGIAVDSFGAAYITGTTLSLDYPTTQNGFQRACGTDGECDKTGDRYFTDAVVTKLNPAGSELEYSSYYTSSPVTPSHEQGLAIAVDANGDAFVTGSTTINDSAFVIGIDSTGSAPLYQQVLLNGNGNDQGFGIAATRDGVATVTGFTNSTNFPVTGNALQATSGGAADGFVARISDHGVPTYVSYLGGAGADQGNAVGLDSTGVAYVTGVTNSRAATLPFAIPGTPLQNDCTLNALLNCDGDAFVAKMDLSQAGAASLLYFTYLGGSNAETGAGIAVDTVNSAYVTGFTNSSDFPVFGEVFQSNYGGGNTDAFVSKLDATASALVYSSYLGGTNAEDGKAIAVDVNGNAYVAGQTCSSDFPTARPLQPAQAGNCDAFVSKVLVGPDISLSHSTLVFAAQSVGSTSPAQTITVSSSGDAPLTISDITTTGNFSQTNTCVGVALAVGDTCTIDVVFSPTAAGTRTGTLTITDDTPTSPHVVNLSGTTSVPVVSLSSTSLSFGSVPIGTTSQSKTLTLTNSGTATLNVASIAVSSEFAETNTCGAIVAVGANCTISVTFTPTAGGTRSGTLTITDDAGGSPHVVSLSGDGSGFTLSAAPASVMITAGQTATYTLSVNPTSGFNSEVTLSCSGAPRGATCTISPASVTPGGNNAGTATVTVASQKRTIAPPLTVPDDFPPSNTGLWNLGFLGLAALAFLAAARSRRLRAGLVLTAAMLALLVWASCGGGGSSVGVPRGTPAGDYTLTFTGAAGSGTQQTTVQLTVQ